jgi:predicted AlkP superfamily pyrophosphatase or phosphodiesterase
MEILPNSNQQLFNKFILYICFLNAHRMKIFSILFSLIIISLSANCQKPKSVSTKPKLVVGIVIDQMRWDYLYRFQPLFKSNGGFKRMMNSGFSCDNTMVPYAPTVTACGHTCIYTGSVPNIHGIVGNNWWDKSLNKLAYCTEDRSIEGVGNTKGDAGKMSPRNMLVTTISDELRLTTNFKSKVIGVAIKDRGAILPAGQSANAAYWYDKGTGSFISSSYYMKELPTWLNEFNSRKLVDSFYRLGWNIQLSKETYLNYCTDDVKPYEYNAFEDSRPGFPYNNLSKFINKDYSKIISTPYGNTLTAEVAKAILINEKMGKGAETDFLAISFSSPDYVGHSFGPNSWELLDCYIKLDDELGKLFDALDKQVGVSNYISFLTADHAVAHIPAFMQEHKLPGGTFDDNVEKNEINKQLKGQFAIDTAILSFENYQLTINKKSIQLLGIDEQKIVNWIINYLKQNEAILNVFELNKLMGTPMNNTIKERLANGYFENRSGDIQVILKSGYIDGMKTGTTHGLWNPYDAHIPLLWYGWGIKKGSTHKETYMTDIAATLAALLNIQMPSGCIGKVIEDVLK